MEAVYVAMICVEEPGFFDELEDKDRAKIPDMDAAKMIAARLDVTDPDHPQLKCSCCGETILVEVIKEKPKRAQVRALSSCPTCQASISLYFRDIDRVFWTGGALSTPYVNCGCKQSVLLVVSGAGAWRFRLFTAVQAVKRLFRGAVFQQ